MKIEITEALANRLTIAATARGESMEMFADRCLRQGVEAEFGAMKARSFLNLLAPRERQAAELAALGLTDRQIAQEMFIGTETVKTYMTAVRSQFGVRNKAELREILKGVNGHA